MASDRIIVRGAREHNLKNIDVEIPRDQLVVITGLSGSGKSSLAFDTIYAEGQRRYVESLSAYARQFLEQMEKPEVDSIEGLSPAISIEQKTTSKNPRSTVGTVTEIYDYLRVLFARVGIPHCPELRPRDLRADRAADGGSRADAAGGHAAAGPGAGHPRAQGRVQEALLRSAAAGLLAGARQRHRSASSARTSSSTASASTRSKSSSTASSSATTSAPASPTHWKPPSASPTASCRSNPLAERGADSSTDGRDAREGRAEYGTAVTSRERGGLGGAERAPQPNNQGRSRTPANSRAGRVAKPRRSPWSSPNAWPAPSAASPSPRSRRGCSRSTTRTAPARSAAASARGGRSIPSGWCPIRPARSRPGRWRRGRGVSRPISGRRWPRWPSATSSRSTSRGRSCARARGT